MKQQRTEQDPAWSHPLAVSDLPPEGVVLKLVPSEDERAALARYVDVLALPALVADVKVTPDGKGGVTVEGDLVATVRQNCVVSLDPFDNPVNERVALQLVPESAVSAARDESEQDPADVIKNGVIDLGALIAEFLVLGIDPYPRRPGAVFAPPAAAQGDEASTPFAALAKLKQKDR